MRILILEDSSERIKYFIDHFYDHELVITEKSNIAIDHLNVTVFDYIFLDNDLGNNNGSGIDVAVFLSSGLSINNDAMVIIHSWNTPAVIEMVGYLPEARVLPYGTKDFNAFRIRNRGL